MLPISGKKIFSSRWWALIFAGSICWTAIDTASNAPHKSGNAAEDANAAADDAATAKALGDALNGM